MAFVRALTMLLKDKNIGRNIVPIVRMRRAPFGMEGLFRQIGIYSSSASCIRRRTRRRSCLPEDKKAR